MKSKLRIGVIFGGRSGEHEVSLRSAESIINALDKSKYDVVPIGISKAGRWLVSTDATRMLPQAVMEATQTHKHVAIIGDPTQKGLLRLDESARGLASEKLDVVFPVLHGTYGEDGTIQGLLEMAGVAYVGCGVLASATGMDKVLMKHLFQKAGLTIAPFEWFLRAQWEADADQIISRIKRTLGFPCFVKPANLGSSVGVSKANNEPEFREAVEKAANYDRKVVVERAVVGREIEVAVLGNDAPIASLPGEIILGHEFYDYEDKYIDNASRTEVPAKLPPQTIEQLQRDAIAAFQSIDGSGLARVDFFVEAGTGTVIINEINTMPGFTSISMYPKMWAASGISYPELIDRLVGLALERHEDRSRNVTSYEPHK
ncbi:MAG TPA: D-alanine--D-alanine ligase family protein [Blastocatellia bacterium]|nr:D-alanine--D-alanine ligase family protein [Blastocatellia bacterium]